jgi:hypothetical protein
MTLVNGVQAMSKEEADNLAVLYKENAEVTKTFWEWRHKIMTRFFAGAAGIVIGASWMYERCALRPWLFGFFVIGGVFCIISWWLDKVNMEVLGNCYRVGSDLEMRLAPQERGIYRCIDENFGNMQYHRTLSIMYWVSAIVLFGVGLVTFLYLR